MDKTRPLKCIWQGQQFDLFFSPSLFSTGNKLSTCYPFFWRLPWRSLSQNKVYNKFAGPTETTWRLRYCCRLRRTHESQTVRHHMRDGFSHASYYQHLETFSPTAKTKGLLLLRSSRRLVTRYSGGYLLSLVEKLTPKWIIWRFANDFTVVICCIRWSSFKYTDYVGGVRKRQKGTLGPPSYDQRIVCF